MKRLNIMLEIYKLKWTMIILNPIIKNVDNNNLAEIKLLKAKNYKKESLLRIEKINKRYK